MWASFATPRGQPLRPPRQAPPPDAIAPSVGTPPTPMAVARALRHGGHVACPMMLAAQAPAPATATASSSLRREGGNAVASRAERGIPQYCFTRVAAAARANGRGESPPGDRAAPSSLLAMGVVPEMAMGGSRAAGEADWPGEAWGSACGGGDVWRRGMFCFMR